MHGKMQHTADEFAATAAPGSSASPLNGVGATMEGIGNTEVMFDLLFDLPWHPEITADSTGVDRWLDNYAASRYGTGAGLDSLRQALRLLKRSVFNCPAKSFQQGPTESLFCARPALNVKNASTWANATLYWNPADVAEAARLMEAAGDSRQENANFRHDLADTRRQAIADQGRLTFDSIMAAINAADTAALRRHGDRFLELFLLQDRLLAPHPEFNVDTWVADARRAAEAAGSDPDLNEWNARTQITVWGNRDAADRGGLHDYGNKEWAGLLSQFYYPRWQKWLNAVGDAIASGRSPESVEIDWYEEEYPWTLPRKQH